MASNVMGMFNNNDKRNLGNINKLTVDNTNDSISNIPASDLQTDNLPGSGNTLPPTKDGQRKPSALGSSFTQQQAIRNQIVQ